MLETYTDLLEDSDHPIDYYVHGLSASMGTVVSTLEQVRLKPRKTLDRKLTLEIQEQFGKIYWHFAQVVRQLDIQPDEVQVEAEEIHDIEEADRHFDEGFQDLRKASIQVTRLAEVRKKKMEGANIDPNVTMFAEFHGRMRKAIHHFGLFDLRLVLERNLQQIKNDKSVTLYDKPKDS